MQSVVRFLRSRLLPLLVVCLWLTANVLYAQANEIPQPAGGFNAVLLVALFLGIVAHWLKSYVRGQVGDFWTYVSTGWSNTLVTFFGAVGIFIGTYNAAPSNYNPVTFMVLFNVFLLGFSMDSVAGGTAWKNPPAAPSGKP